MAILAVIFYLFYIIFWHWKVEPRIEGLLEWWHRMFSVRSDPAIMKIIASHFSYYQKLDNENKKRFETRLALFLKSKLFIPMDGLALNNNMKALIGASAIQLTFGLRYYRLRYFHRICVYPDVYHYRGFKMKFRGHVSSRGLIHLSWHHFEKGYLFPEDGVNLGLHEMAHALKLHAIVEGGNNEFYENVEAMKKYARIGKHQISTAPVLISERGDVDELWAVAVERFFETPGKFNEKLPRLFDSMKRTLNQDPLNAIDPIIDKKRA